MTHGSLFSGIGGFDLAAQWMGWENVFHCEINKFGQRVLHHYWPESIQYHDITKTDFTIHRGRVDIISGGFPCQPFSAAGKRLGTADNRHLWPEMLRAIREIQPRWVVGENVRGLINWSKGLVFEQVQIDLENEGYQVTPFLLPACSVNAPHRRDRIWFVAYSGLQRQTKRQQRSMGANQLCEERSSPDTEAQGRGEGIRQKADSERRKMGEHGQERNDSRTGSDTTESSPFAGGVGCDNGSDHRQERHIPHDQRTSTQDQSERSGRECGVGPAYADTSYTDSKRLEGESSKRIQEGQGGGCRLQPGNIAWYRDSRWETFPTQSPVRGRDDGLPTKLDGITFSKWRKESIMAYGNAVVPQVVYQIFKSIQDFENLK